MSSTMAWQQVTDRIRVFKDSCNVYAVSGPEGLLVIDAGTGAWLEHLDALPAAPTALLLTHYFRDHAAGAVRAARRGIPVYVPEHEHDLLTDPAQHFRERENYMVYENLWDHFAPIEPIDGAAVMLDYAIANLAGLEVEAIPLPGVTISQTGFGMTIGGKLVIFCGEAIHSPGKLARVAPLQYYYNDLRGANNCRFSAQVLRDQRPSILLPSLGEPIRENIDEALATLKDNLSVMIKMRPDTEEASEYHDRLIRVSDHVWRSDCSVARTHFLISESGRAMAIDYGYLSGPVQYPAFIRPARRRALLHGLGALKEQFGIDRLDMVLVSHFHDDHIAGIPVLQRLFDTECWATENFADLLEHPEAHSFPCTWPKPIRVHRRLPLNETVRWEEYTFHLAPMNGHTRFASLIGFEADGLRYAHTGDQYQLGADENEDFNGLDAHNFVFRNGSMLDGYRQSGCWLAEWHPDILISGHWETKRTNEKFFQDIAKYTERYEQMHRNAMPLEDDAAHFDVDSWGGWIWPYRVVLAEPQETSVRVHVRNPYPELATLEVRLVGPSGWTGTSETLEAPARAEVSCELSITPAGTCRRQPFAAELTANGQPFGQVAEALMTVGADRF